MVGPWWGGQLGFLENGMKYLLVETVQFARTRQPGSAQCAHGKGQGFPEAQAPGTRPSAPSLAFPGFVEGGLHPLPPAKTAVHHRLKHFTINAVKTQNPLWS